MRSPPIIRAAAWLTRENFPAHRALDPNGLQASFDEWLRDAERITKEFERDGGIVERVVIDPDQLVTWCRSRGCDVNSRARAQFAIETLDQSRKH